MHGPCSHLAAAVCRGHLWSTVLKLQLTFCWGQDRPDHQSGIGRAATCSLALHGLQMVLQKALQRLADAGASC